MSTTRVDHVTVYRAFHEGQGWTVYSTQYTCGRDVLFTKPLHDLELEDAMREERRIVDHVIALRSPRYAFEIVA